MMNDTVVKSYRMTLLDRAQQESRDCLIYRDNQPPQQPLIMTTVDPDDDIEKLPHIQWDNTVSPGPSGCMFPGGLTPLECQIAGHPFNGEKQTIGKHEL